MLQPVNRLDLAADVELLHRLEEVLYGRVRLVVAAPKHLFCLESSVPLVKSLSHESIHKPVSN